MNSSTIQLESFRHYIFNTNKKLFWISIAMSLMLWSIFKYFYPYPDFFSDSYSYIYAASENLNISIWPIGYSKFLNLFHHITHSDVALVTFQYLLYIFSALFAYNTICYHYYISYVNKKIVYAFLFCNPLIFYISNYVNSDPLFLSLSLLWLSMLIWSMETRNIFHLITTGLLLFFCFTVRNNAYYYPVVTIAAILLSKHFTWIKATSTLIYIVLIGAFIGFTKHEAKEITGHPQYSLFTGWQLANNALYMYPFISVDTTIFKSTATKELYQITDSFFKRQGLKVSEVLPFYEANFFIVERTAPLKVYVRRHYKIPDERSSIISWGKSSAIFSEFGYALIKNHPLEYLKHFVVPNTKNYFLPPLEKLHVYNLGLNEVDEEAQFWFDFPTPRVMARSYSIQDKLLAIYPSLFMFVNVLWLLSIILIISRGLKSRVRLENMRHIIVFTLFIILNFLFSVSATINVLRYQVFPFLLTIISACLISQLVDIKKTKGTAVSMPSYK